MTDFHPAPADRDRSINWARAMMARPFIVLDTETSGLLRDKQSKRVTAAEIVQIGILSSDGLVLLDSFVKPSAPIPLEATAIHGITNEMVADAPSFDAIWPRVRPLLAGQMIAIYNLDYDRGLLARHLSVMFGDVVDAANWLCSCRWQCAMLRYAAYVGEVGYYGDYKWQKLPNGDDDAHSAISDCKATLRLIRGMAASPLSTEPAPAHELQETTR